MGDEICKDHFEEKDYQLFNQKLEQEMDFIRNLFASNAFDNQTRKLGYELELCLLDHSGAPAPFNQQVLDQADNPLFTYELARYNLEINGNAFTLDSQVFKHIEQDLTELYQQVVDSAATIETEVGLFGVLPSLQLQHLDSERFMSGLFRYRLLNKCLMDMRQRDVHMELTGQDHLIVDKNDVMLEALGTSLQVHYQFPFDEAVDSYHAALWSSIAAVAVSANSPLVLQSRGWQESRIAIFKQSVDTRNPQEMHDSVVPRVHFAKGYIKSWLELFEDNSYYTPILPEAMDTPVEELHHFKLHNGTIWRWVRPILDRSGERFHCRLELRVVPSGPTLIDTLCNMAFHVGLTEGLKQDAAALTRIPYESLEQDFYQAARLGLDANVSWCHGEMDTMQNMLLKHAIPTAYQGLQKLGVENPEHWLDIIEQRVKTGKTGADWISRHWEKYQNENALVHDYLANARQNIPVHRWPEP